MLGSQHTTPGVYIQEQDSFQSTLNRVPTAIPAFIGYTAGAFLDGQASMNKAVKINSFADFVKIYGYQQPADTLNPLQNYSPTYYWLKQAEQPEQGSYLKIDGAYYLLVPDPNTIYYMYNSVRLFYENGGGEAYIVSVGGYGSALENTPAANAPLINPNVILDELLKGIRLLKTEEEPTFYICPDATLLSAAENSNLMEAMLLQCNELKTCMSIFDVIGGKTPDPILYTQDITAFREGTGVVGLRYGAAYYPFVKTTIMGGDHLNYTNFFTGQLAPLKAIISPDNKPNAAIDKIIAEIEQDAEGEKSQRAFNQALIAASPVYAQMHSLALADANILPPSGGMAGVMTRVDEEQGVWQAPANTSMVSVADVTIRLSENEQGPLNVDALTGKSINAIRFFNGIGVLIWGARTLDGNSLDWRYINVGRTMIMIEQSCKRQLETYAFSSNNANTWNEVKACLSGFLNDLWRDGALQGVTASESFAVECGLGVTMTANDVQEGRMIVLLKLAMTRPAEFIIINLEQSVQI